MPAAWVPWILGQAKSDEEDEGEAAEQDRLDSLMDALMEAAASAEADQEIGDPAGPEDAVPHVAPDMAAEMALNEAAVEAAEADARFASPPQWLQSALQQERFHPSTLLQSCARHMHEAAADTARQAWGRCVWQAHWASSGMASRGWRSCQPHFSCGGFAGLASRQTVSARLVLGLGRR